MADDTSDDIQQRIARILQFPKKPAQTDHLDQENIDALTRMLPAMTLAMIGDHFGDLTNSDALANNLMPMLRAPDGSHITIANKTEGIATVESILQINASRRNQLAQLRTLATVLKDNPPDARRQLDVAFADVIERLKVLYPEMEW